MDSIYKILQKNLKHASRNDKMILHEIAPLT